MTRGPAPCAVILVLALSGTAAAEEKESSPRYEFYASPTIDAESGARILGSAVTGIGAGEAWLFERGRGEGEPGGAGRIALRSIRVIAWDAPIAWWFGVALHETFGHGGRGREFHASPGVHLGSPWGGRNSFATFDGEGKSTEELLYIYSGGAEANGLGGTLLERRAVEGVRMRPIDLLFLVSNRLVVSDYVLRTTPNPRTRPARFFTEFSGGGDVANYLGLLHQLQGAGTGITSQGVDDAVFREYRRLRRQAYWNLLDPGTWWAVGSTARMVWHGDDSPAIPLPRLGRFRFLPVLSSEWTPSGGEASLEWIMAPRENAGRRSPSWFSFVARRGRGPSGSFGALGAVTAEALPAGPFLLGGMAEIWRDPLHGPGGGARLRARLDRGPLRGLYFDLGVKSQGYWIGQPATPGPYGAVGLVFPP